MSEALVATYVYAVIRSSAPLELTSGGVGSERPAVRRLACRDIAAVVSDLREGRLAAARDVRAHWAVLEEAAHQVTVLPVRFGTVMESDDAVIREFLEPRAERVGPLLAELDGTAQVTVKATYDEERLMREIVLGDPHVARVRERVQSLPEAAAYYDRIRLGELVAAAVESKREDDGALVLRRLEPLAEGARSEPPSTTDTAVHVAFLVRRERIEEFRRAVDKLASELADRIRMRCVGPLPTYSFADDDAQVRSGAWA